MQRFSPFLFLAASLLTACALGVSPKSEKRTNATLDASSITNLQINSSSGNVTIAAAAAGNANVAFTKTTPDLGVSEGACTSDQHIDGTTLVVTVTHDKLANCIIDTQITIPAATTIDASLDDGSIKITDVTGVVSAHTGDGYIDASLASPGGESPTLNDSFDTSDGNIQVQVNFAPSSGNISLKTKNGGIKLELPVVTKFAVDESHQNGTFTNDLTAIPGAPFDVTMTSQDGNLTIAANQ